jgi:hypothetical protein
MGPRVGAGTYLLAMSATVNAWCLAMVGLFYLVISPGRLGPPQAAYVVWVLGGVVGYVFFYLSRRRFQDLDCPGYWARILAFPIPGVVLLPVLCFLSAPRFRNRFGTPPPPSRPLKVILALASFVGALIFVPVVAALYAPLQLHSAF